MRASLASSNTTRRSRRTTRATPSARSWRARSRMPESSRRRPTEPRSSRASSITPTSTRLWLLSDSLAAGRDAVMGPGGGTEHLARLSRRPFNGAALDVGCGAGSLALIAARAGARRARGRRHQRARHRDCALQRAIERARRRVSRGRRCRARRRRDVQPGDLSAAVRRATRRRDRAHVPVRRPRRRRPAAPFSSPNAEPPYAPWPPRAGSCCDRPARDDLPLVTRMRNALGGAPVDLLAVGARTPTLATQASVFASFEDGALGARLRRGGEALSRPLRGAPDRALRRSAGGPSAVAGDARSTRPANRRGGTRVGIQVAHADYDGASLDRYLPRPGLAVAPPDDCRARLLAGIAAAPPWRSKAPTRRRRRANGG